MRSAMTSIAVLCLLLVERFLASDMDSITQPVLNGLRGLEKTALQYTREILPSDVRLGRSRPMTRYYLFTSDHFSEGQVLDPNNPLSFRFFNPRLETKIIIHGFLDQVKLAKWMHQMKNEFLLLDDYNIIVVDWSDGNFLPYTQAAKNTEQAGEEISKLLMQLRDTFGAKPEKFHLLGHSLGAHVAGYVGERVKGLKRITGLDPATYLFSDAKARKKLDRSDAEFVDIIHTDGGGIGVKEPVGHVDFYPNGGEVQKGCTASNSLRSLFQYGVVEGFRNVICSHMRAPYLFTSTINARHCQMHAYKCPSWESFVRGECDSCGNEDCPTLGYHTDTHRDYGNFSKYYLLTSDSHPYCGYEYKLSLNRLNETISWPHSDILLVSIYGSSGNAEFEIQGKEGEWQEHHVVFSPSFLGDVMGAILRWERRSLARTRGLSEVVSRVVGREDRRPLIISLNVSPFKTFTHWRISPIIFELCISPVLYEQQNQQGATFRSEYC